MRVVSHIYNTRMGIEIGIGMGRDRMRWTMDGLERIGWDREDGIGWNRRGIGIG